MKSDRQTTQNRFFFRDAGRELAKAAGRLTLSASVSGTDKTRIGADLCNSNLIGSVALGL
jgi:hypothetical protein